MPPKGDNTRREEIKTELAEIRDKQADLKKSRRAVYEQLDAINDSIKKKVGSIKIFQTKIPFKTTAEVDAHIAYVFKNKPYLSPTNPCLRLVSLKTRLKRV